MSIRESDVNIAFIVNSKVRNCNFIDQTQLLF